MEEKKKRGRPVSGRAKKIKLTLELSEEQDLLLKKASEKTGLSRTRTIFKALENI